MSCLVLRLKNKEKCSKWGDEKCSERVDIWLHGAMIDGWIFVGTQTEAAFLIFFLQLSKICLCAVVPKLSLHKFGYPTQICG